MFSTKCGQFMTQKLKLFQKFFLVIILPERIMSLLLEYLSNIFSGWKEQLGNIKFDSLSS